VYKRQRLYGFKKLSDLIKSHSKRFELEARGTTSTGGKALYARNLKPQKLRSHAGCEAAVKQIGEQTEPSPLEPF
jgi:hypothetical protein